MNPKDFQKYATQHKGINSLGLHDYMSAINSTTSVPPIGSTVPNIFGLTPNIIEERQMNAVVMDVFSRLMMDRIIFLGTAIDSFVANVVSAQLLWMQSVDPKKDISIYINSPGGSVYAGLGIYDTMQIVSPDVSTICTGIAASMGAVLLCAGEKGKRSGLPHSRVMIHQPLGGVGGQATDVEIVHKQIQLLKKELYDIISKHSGKTYDEVWNDSDRDFWMTSAEAQEYGLIDEVLTADASES